MKAQQDKGKCAILKGPHGFTTYHDFMEGLGDGGTHLRTKAAEKRRFVAWLEKLEDPKFFPYNGITEDLMASGRVREVRKLGNGDGYVRYEVQTMQPYTDGQWDAPHQLLVRWSPRGDLRAYTFIFGRGKKPKFGAFRHVERGNLVRDNFTDSKKDVKAFLMDMRENESCLIGNEKCNGEFVTFGYGDGKLLMSWQVGGEAWACNSVGGITKEEAIHAVDVFATEGVVGVQQLCHWEAVEHYDSVSKRTSINIDNALRRQLLRALRTNNEKVMKIISSLGITLDGSNREPYEVSVDYSSQKQMMKEIYAREVMSRQSRKAFYYLALLGFDRKAAFGEKTQVTPKK